MREKLIELLEKSPYLDVLGGWEFYERAADHLIANGVTVPVRCKDCDSYNKEGCADGFGWCKAHDRGMMDWDYCSMGGKNIVLDSSNYFVFEVDDIDFDYNAEDVKHGED